MRRAPEPRLCGAPTRSGAPCRRRVPGRKRRCERHGRAAGAGAPKGNANARTHGFYTAEERARRRAISRFIRDCVRTLRRVEGR